MNGIDVHQKLKDSDMGAVNTDSVNTDQIKNDPANTDKIELVFNDVFRYIGDVGLYQILLYFLLGLTAFFNGLHNTSNNFYAAPMEHWCHVPRLENFPHDIQKKVVFKLNGFL